MKKLLLNDLTHLNSKFEGWMHQFEYDYLKANHELIYEYLNDLSFLPTECDGVIGGITFALSLNDEQRLVMANLWGKTFIKDAKNRIPHLKYLKEDFYARKSLEINDLHLDSLIHMSEEVAERDEVKWVNANTFVDMKIKEFIDLATLLKITKPSRHQDVMFYLFKKFNYENRFKTLQVDSVDKKWIEKRYYRIIKKDFLPTVFNISIPPKV